MRAKCKCDKAAMVLDAARRAYMPYCIRYDVWLEYDRRFTISLTTKQAYRPEICFLHGSPEDDVRRDLKHYDELLSKSE